MHPEPGHARRAAAIACAGVCIALSSQAAVVDVTVMAQNLVPASGIAFAPLHLGFHSGSFDAFDPGGTATAPIIAVPEPGSLAMLTAGLLSIGFLARRRRGDHSPGAMTAA